MSPIIPGLIDDLGRECLIRMSYQDLPTASSVCKTWRTEVTGQDIRRFRKAAGVSRPLIILAQAKTADPNLDSNSNPGHIGGEKSNPPRPTYQLTLYDTCIQTWTRLPMIPGMPDGLPMFCGLVGSGSDIIVIGGWDPVTWRALSGVFIYSFLDGRWRKGADMPGVRRSFFGCDISETEKKVLIAGGHDEDKNALKSALMYDVEEDVWTPLPDMERARDECKVICHRGKFHVISGYPTDTQGCFERTAEVFDTNTSAWHWGNVVVDFLEESLTPSTCVEGYDGRIYGIVNGDVAVRLGDRWQVIGKVPADVASSLWVGSYEGYGNFGASSVSVSSSEEKKIVVIGASGFGEAHNGYVLDLRSKKWSKIDVPIKFSGHVQCGCVIEL